MASSMGKGVGEERDILQATLLITSYFKEAVDTINTKYSWRLVEAGLAAGYQLPMPIEDLKRFFSRNEGSLYKQGVYDIRRTKGFHVNEKHFRDWLSQLQSPFVTLWRKETRSPLDWAFTASAQIQSFFGVQMADEDGLKVVRVLGRSDGLWAVGRVRDRSAKRMAANDSSRDSLRILFL